MRRLALILTAALALGLLACGSKSAPPAGNNGTATAAATAAAKATTGGSSSSEASALLSNYSKANYTVTYHMETAAPSAPASVITWTWYQDASGKRSRFDFDQLPAGGAPGAGATTIISTGTDSIFCSNGRCLSLAGAGAAIPNPSTSFTGQVGEVEGHVRDGSAREVAKRTIAGVQARCFEFDDAKAQISKGTSCMSAEGVPLLSEWQGIAGKYRLEATAYKNSVGSTDFNPPFPLQALPTVPAR